MPWIKRSDVLKYAICPPNFTWRKHARERCTWSEMRDNSPVVRALDHFSGDTQNPEGKKGTCWGVKNLSVVFCATEAGMRIGRILHDL